MAFRDELGAAQARADALERKLAEAEAENRKLRGEAAEAEEGGPDQVTSLGLASKAKWVFVVAALLLSAGLFFGVIIVLPLVVMLIMVGIILVVVDSLLIVVPPNRVAVLSGRQHRGPDGTVIGYRVVRGGRLIRIPLLERVDWLDTGNNVVVASVSHAYCKGNQSCSMQVTAMVKISSDPAELGNAVERFLGRGRDEIKQVATETLEGNLRSIIATLSLEEIRGDDLRFRQAVLEESDQDFSRLGLTIDTISIDSIEG